MGLITTVGRVVLVVLNICFLLISLALIAVGAILKYFVDKILPYIGDLDAVDDQTQGSLGIPKLSDVTNLPFVDDVGTTLLVFGCVLFIISFCACCGACCQFRPLLIAFAILMVVLVLTQAVIGGLFMAKDSALHKKIKSELGDQMKEEYGSGGDTLTSAINMLNYLLDCCGVNGWDDFPDDKPAMSCCKRSVMTSNPTNCDNPTSPFIDFNEQGCYDKLVDKALSNLTLAAVIFALILILQVVEIVFAILIVKEASSVGPV